MTAVINIKDAPRGWKLNPNYVYIGRPSKWGNPFTVAIHGQEGAVEVHARWVRDQEQLLIDLDQLKDKTLVCYCKPLACHGDMLATLAGEK